MGFYVLIALRYLLLEHSPEMLIVAVFLLYSLFGREAIANIDHLSWVFSKNSLEVVLTILGMLQ